MPRSGRVRPPAEAEPPAGSDLDVQAALTLARGRVSGRPGGRAPLVPGVLLTEGLPQGVFLRPLSGRRRPGRYPSGQSSGRHAAGGERSAEADEQEAGVLGVAAAPVHAFVLQLPRLGAGVLDCAQPVVLAMGQLMVTKGQRVGARCGPGAQEP
jgi:hypothetical protein